jgi:TolB-like protein/tetratricopeptide (TPR) repeat protein
MQAIPLVLIATLALWSGFGRHGVPADSGIDSIAVLPFLNLTGQADQEYLADGVTEILIGNLAQLRSIRVISRTSTMAYKGTRKPLATIAHELNVNGIIEGSVARSGDRLRVTVQLVRANEEHVWGQAYERPAADLFRVQGEISGMVADAIKLSLTPAERKSLTATPAVQVQAQDAFLRGLQLLNDQQPESLRAALASLQEAVRLDPTSARVYATLSQCYLLAGTRDIMTPDQSYTKALTAATRALQLDDTVAEAHTQLAEVKFYFEWDWPTARRGYERALALNPNDSHALARYSQFLSALDEQDAALEHATRAQALDPISRTVRFAPGMVLFYARRYDEAIAAFLHLKDIPPFSLSAPEHFGLARAYAGRGRFDDAIHEIALATSLKGPLTVWTAELARIHAETGNRPEAQRLLGELTARGNAVTPASLAFIYAALGDVDRAFQELDRAADQRAPVLLWANVDPRLDTLRGDARYRALTKRIGLPQ